MRNVFFLLLLPLFVPSAAYAQSFQAEFLRQFDNSSSKVVSLSASIPNDFYEWSPADGVMSVGLVYAHIARYNFMYLEENLGIPAPDDVDLATMESLTEKDQIRALLERSVAHVKTHVAAMSAADLDRQTTLYGRDLAGWAVLFQLLAHMNEHVGQSVSYARMNGIKPPWAR